MLEPIEIGVDHGIFYTLGCEISVNSVGKGEQKKNFKKKRRYDKG